MVYGIRAIGCAKRSCFSKIAIELPKFLQSIQKVASCCFELLKQFGFWSLAQCSRSSPKPPKNDNPLQKIPPQEARTEADQPVEKFSIEPEGELLVPSSIQELLGKVVLREIALQEKNSGSFISEDSPALLEKTESEDSFLLSPKKKLAEVGSSGGENPQSTWVQLPASHTVFSFLHPSVNSQPWLVLNPVKPAFLRTEELAPLKQEDQAEASFFPESKERETPIFDLKISLMPESFAVKKDLAALSKEDEVSIQEVVFSCGSSLLLPPEPEKTKKGSEELRCMNLPNSKNFLASPSAQAQPWI